MVTRVRGDGSSRGFLIGVHDSSFTSVQRRVAGQNQRGTHGRNQREEHSFWNPCDRFSE